MLIDRSFLSVSQMCMYWHPDGSGVTLLPNLSFLPKMGPSSHVNQAIDLAAFSPPSLTQQATELSKQLCPVRTLKAYVAATALLRKSDKLFVMRVMGRSTSVKTEAGLLR